MRIQRYRARTVAEALRQVRAELGPSAVILETRPVRGTGLAAWRRVGVEVVAAIDDPVAPPRPAPPPRPPAGVEDLRAAIEELRRDLRRHLSAGRSSLLARLEREGVTGEEAHELVRPEAEGGGEPSHGAVRRRLENLFGPPAPLVLDDGKGRTVVLVGPTGVGKTTTLAKLAARLTLVDRASVGLITADTYRIAAVQQLRTYAEILGVPLVVASTPEELRRARKELVGRDVILVDTAGRSPRHALHMSELRGHIAALEPDEVHLVLSLTTRGPDMAQAAEAFAQARFDRYLFTKLDEASSPVAALAALLKVPRPVSYVTTGQRVPEDLEVAHPGRLAEEVLRALVGEQA